MSKNSGIGHVWAANVGEDGRPNGVGPVWIENISAIGGGGGSIPSEVSGKWEDASNCVESNSAAWSEVSFTGVNVSNTLTGDGKNTPLGLNTPVVMQNNESTASFNQYGMSVNDGNGMQTLGVNEIKNWNDVSSTVNSNSASWGGGSTGDMSAYVPFSANNLAFLGTNANYKNSAVGSNAFAHGNLNFASAMSLAQGYGNIAGRQSLAQGGSCSSYICSLAQGTHCYASAYSLAQGDNCYASAHSFAQGTYCTAESFSISNGNSNFANDYSQAFGRYNHITNSGMVIGAFNKTSSDVSFVIGNGSANTARSDSFVVYHNGSVSAAGNVSANGHELPIVEYVSNSAAATGTNILYVVTGSN